MSRPGLLLRWCVPDLAFTTACVTLFYCLFLFQGYQKLFRDSDAGWHIRTGEAILATGKPTIAFLQHGRPNSINYVAENVPAILDGWYLGQEGGTAIADVIFGDYNPAGRLPITVPRSVGQLPDYYYQKPAAKREYLGASTLPLFPFGWGLSYTTFKYANVRMAPDTIGPLGTTAVSVDVSNCATMARCFCFEIPVTESNNDALVFFIIVRTKSLKPCSNSGSMP